MNPFDLLLGTFLTLCLLLVLYRLFFGEWW